MDRGLNVRSEIGELRVVMLHRPGDELLNLSPDTLGPLLFDDIPYLSVAQQEHDSFAGMLRSEGVEVVYLDKLVAEALDAEPTAREKFTDDYLAQCGVDGLGVKAAIRERLDSIPDTLEFVRKTITGVRADELDVGRHGAMSLADVLEKNGEDNSGIVVDPIPNIYFTRDTFSVIGSGVSMNRMRSATRRRESLYGTYLFRYHPAFKGAPLWYSPKYPYHIEGGDILVLQDDLIAVGISERTQPAAIDLLAKNLLWGKVDSGIRRVYAFSIPHKRSFMHLDTVFTQVDVDKFTVHPGILGRLSVFELTRGSREGETRIRQMEGSLDKILAHALGLPAVRLIKCGGDDPIASAREQWNDGSNTLAVRPGTVFVYQRNAVTNDILYKEGLTLLEVPSAELSRGRGGPHCMSMAFLRDAVE
ncbi:MAG: arginine deiminase [Tractidigestivibacter sp.]|uniref:arginine deiminase n=1 Tax=Tractidigestivibacter sp. TaxID=2847320 RepID=UPI003D8A1C95